ncbi:MAG: type IV pilus assembly protein PilM [Firmicutes bacterium]|nr:type IV pilus assembly protein PilM [Bacillota bacterium]
MGLWGRNGIVGVELDSRMLRAVEVKGKSSKPCVVGAGRVQVPEGAVSDGVVNDANAVGKALQKLWQEAKLGSRRVALGIFNRSVLVRMITFSRLPEEKLKKALHLQAGEYLPVPVSQMVLDFAVVGSVDNERLNEVLLVAAGREELTAGLQALLHGKLAPVVVDASPLALPRILPPAKRQGTTAIVDLAKGTSSIVIAANGMPRFARMLPVSLQQCLKSLGVATGGNGRHVKFVAAAAEKNTEEDVYVRHWSKMVAREIKISLGYYVRHDRFREVDRLVLSGRGAGVTGLASLLQEELQLPTEVAVPQAAVSVQGELSVDLSQPEFAVSMGLALRGLEV